MKRETSVLCALEDGLKSNSATAPFVIQIYYNRDLHFKLEW